jgi:hypothetical protein
MYLSKQRTVLAVASLLLLLLSVNVVAQGRPGGPGLRRGAVRLGAPRLDPAPTAQAQHTNRTRRDTTPQELEAVIRQFWDGLGRLDADQIKQTVDFPVTIIESSSTGSKQANVIRSPSEIDDEMKRAPASAVQKGRSEFFGTKLMGFKVQMFGADMASVSYSYRLSHDMLAKNPASKSGAANAMTVLRRSSGTGNRWKIVFTTVPR